MSPGGKASRAKGDRLEYAVIRDLGERGFPLVIRRGGSKFPDIVAIRSDEVALVECKTNGRLDPEEWNKLYNLAMEAGATPVLASREDRQEIMYERIMGRKQEGSRVRSSSLLDEWRW